MSGYDVRDLQRILERQAERPHPPTAFPHGDTKGGTHSHFLVPSEEETRTWGNSGSIAFVGIPAEPITFPGPQLIHILRRRPTSYTVLTVVDFLQGWDGEPSVNWTVNVQIVVGVGQAKVPVLRFINAGTVPLANGLQLIDLLTLPAHAMQSSVSLTGNVAVAGPKALNVTMLAAPVYA